MLTKPLIRLCSRTKLAIIENSPPILEAIKPIIPPKPLKSLAIGLKILSNRLDSVIAFDSSHKKSPIVAVIAKKADRIAFKILGD